MTRMSARAPCRSRAAGCRRAGRRPARRRSHHVAGRLPQPPGGIGDPAGGRWEPAPEAQAVDGLDLVRRPDGGDALGATQQVAGLGDEAGVERGGGGAAQPAGAVAGIGREAAGRLPRPRGEVGAPMWAVIVAAASRARGDLLVGSERRAGQVPGARRRALRQRRRQGAVGGALSSPRRAPWYVAERINGWRNASRSPSASEHARRRAPGQGVGHLPVERQRGADPAWRRRRSRRPRPRGRPESPGRAARGRARRPGDRCARPAAGRGAGPARSARRRRAGWPPRRAPAGCRRRPHAGAAGPRRSSPRRRRAALGESAGSPPTSMTTPRSARSPARCGGRRATAMCSSSTWSAM